MGHQCLTGVTPVIDIDSPTPRVWISTADFAELVDIHEVAIRRLRTLESGPFKQSRDFRRIGAKGFRIKWHSVNAQQSLTDWKGVVPVQEETFSRAEPLVDR